MSVKFPMANDPRRHLEDHVREKPKPSVPRVDDPKAIEQTIFEHLKSDASFVPYKVPGIQFDSKFEEAGFLHRRFLLSHVRSWCGLDEGDEPLIVSVLDEMAKKGRIKVFRVELPPRVHHLDVGFACEFARTVRSFSTGGAGGPQIVRTRYYFDEPLRKKEHDRFSILNIAERVAEIRKEVDAACRKKFGWSESAEIEKKLRKIDSDDRIAMRKEISRIADAISGARRYYGGQENDK